MMLYSTSTTTTTSSSSSNSSSSNSTPNNSENLQSAASITSDVPQKGKRPKKTLDLSYLLITFTALVLYILKKRRDFGTTPSVPVHPEIEGKEEKKKAEGQKLVKPDKFENENQPLRIAVIGCGISGSSAAFYTTHLLNNILKQKVDVTIYEASEQPGGRLKYTTIQGTKCEVGGSHIIKDNYYTMRLINGFGLHLSPERKQHVVVWDGDEEKSCFVEDPNSKWNNMVEYLKRYQFGWAILRAKSLVKDLFLKFRNIYRMQLCEKFFVPNESTNAEQIMTKNDLKQCFTWENVEQFVTGINMQKEVQSNFYDFFCNRALPLLGIQNRLVREFIEPILRINYMQNANELSAFAGGVAIAGIISDFRSIQETTSSLVKVMLDDIKPTLKLKTRVKEIEKMLEGDRFLLTSISEHKTEDGLVEQKEEKSEFDYVIIATPLEFGPERIAIKNLELPEILKVDRPFRKAHVTFVVGELNLDYFNVVDQRKPVEQAKFFEHIAIDRSKVPEEEAGDTRLEYGIITMKPKKKQELEFNCISHIANTKDTNEHIYKIFSIEAIPNALLNNLFNMKYSEHHFWKDGAYPILKPAKKEELPPIKLSNHLYYASAFETIVSTIETNLINSRNIAFMIGKDILARTEQTEKESEIVAKKKKDEEEGYTE
jgi:protoporphyrinogen oxidase